jgi:hypothetical protein
LEEALRTYRQIISDLGVRYLEALPNTLARLVFLAGLRNPATGSYEHADLVLLYPGQSVGHALAICHEELFERYLELPLESQQEELRKYLGTSGQRFPDDTAGQWELLDSWIPPSMPDYLKDLFRANLQSLCALLHESSSKARSGK